MTTTRSSPTSTPRSTTCAVSASPTASIGIVGFCFGGRVSFLVALERSRSARPSASTAAASSPPASRSSPRSSTASPTLQTPWLGLFGDRDESIPVDDVEQLRDALGGAPVDTEVVRYADAEHGFHCDVRGAYNADAAADAWTRTLDWFARHLA